MYKMIIFLEKTFTQILKMHQKRTKFGLAQIIGYLFLLKSSEGLVIPHPLIPHSLELCNNNRDVLGRTAKIVDVTTTVTVLSGN